MMKYLENYREFFFKIEDWTAHSPILVYLVAYFHFSSCLIFHFCCRTLKDIKKHTNRELSYI